MIDSFISGFLESLDLKDLLPLTDWLLDTGEDHEKTIEVLRRSKEKIFCLESQVVIIRMEEPTFIFNPTYHFDLVGLVKEVKKRCTPRWKVKKITNNLILEEVYHDTTTGDLTRTVVHNLIISLRSVNCDIPDIISLILTRVINEHQTNA